MQQINLYHSNLKRKELALSFKHLLQGSAAILVFITLIQIVSEYQYYSSKSKLQLTENTLADKKQKLQKFQASLPKVKKDLQLKEKLALLEQDLINKQTVLDVLSDKKLGNTSGFTQHFEGLAKQSKTGLWLTKLHFLQGGTVLDIEGHSTKPELLPQYLQSLSSETAFRGTEFNSFIIHRSTKNKPLRFKINNVSSNKTEPVTGLSSQ